MEFLQTQLNKVFISCKEDGKENPEPPEYPAQMEHLTWGTRVRGRNESALEAVLRKWSHVWLAEQRQPLSNVPSTFSKNPGGIIFRIMGKFILITKWKAKYDLAVYRNGNKTQVLPFQSFYYFVLMTFVRIYPLPCLISYDIESVR